MTSSTARTRRILGVFLGLAALPAAATAQSRPASQILRDFDGVEYPSFSDGADPGSIARFTRAIEAAAARQEELALELLTAHPEHARVVELMRQRWTLFCTVSHAGARVLEETQAYLEPPAAPALRRAAAAARGRAALETELPLAEKRRLVLEGVAAAPGDEYAASAAFQLAKYQTADPKLQRELVDAIERQPSQDAATAEWIAKDAQALRRLLDRVGHPLDVAVAGFETGSPCIVHFASPPGSESHDRDAAALRRLEERHAASRLAVAALPDDSEAVGQNETPLFLLVDRAGVVVAFCFRVEPFEGEVERLLGKPRRRAV